MGLRRHARGVTFIELMTTLLVVSVVVAWVVPSFVELTRNTRAQAQAGVLQRSLNYARNEAVRRNLRVHVSSVNGDADWGVGGWRVWVDGNDDALYDEGGNDVELQVQAPLTGGVTLTAADDVADVVFLGTGFINRSLSADPVSFEYRVAGKCQAGFDVQLLPAGRTAMTPADCEQSDE